ncbi:MFS transporter [Actinomycetes bacterium KLBMP 9797]
MSIADAQPTPRETISAGRLRVALVVILVCQLLIILDVTIVNVAIPQIQHALGFSAASVSWVVNAYTLAFGGLLLLGGRAGDILGQRRVLLAGVLLFTVASLLGGLALTTWWLVAARAAQGIGAALIAPGTLALIATTFPEGGPRTRALAIYSAVSAGGGSIGLLLGGVLTDWVSWRLGLFVNVPLGIAVLLIAPKVVQESRPQPGRFDLGGAVTSTVGMAALVYGLVHAADSGWRDPATLVPVVTGALLLVAFPIIEARAAQPIAPLHLFRHPIRAGGYAAMLLLVAAMFGMFFMLTQFLQQVRGFSPLESGLAFLPMLLPIFTIVQVMPWLLGRVRPMRLVLTGGLLIAAGTAWLTQLSEQSGYAGSVLGPMVLFGVGGGLSFMPMYVISLTGVPPEDNGAASGVLQSVQQVGGALGMAILVTVFGTAARSAEGGARAALTAGVVAAFVVATLFTLVALVVVLLATRAGRRTG